MYRKFSIHSFSDYLIILTINFENNPIFATFSFFKSFDLKKNEVFYLHSSQIKAIHVYSNFSVKLPEMNQNLYFENRQIPLHAWPMTYFQR